MLFTTLKTILKIILKTIKNNIRWRKPVCVTPRQSVMRLSGPLLAAVHNTVRVDQRRTGVLLHHPDGIVPWLWEPPLMVAVRICVATQTNGIQGTMACLTDRTPSGKRLHGRRYATIYRRKVLHYNNGCQHSCHLMLFLDGTSTVKNPLHFSPANQHPCTSYRFPSDVPRISH